MPSFPDLLDQVLADTAACQDPNSLESAARRIGAYQPFGPHLGGGYPTTDAAMEAVCDIADRLRENDAQLAHRASRDQWRKSVSDAIGAHLNELLHEPDAKARWSILRDALKEIGRGTDLDLLHYTPVWLFVGQELEPFTVGPVRFVPRSSFADEVSGRMGAEPDWKQPLARLWAGKRPGGGSWLAGAKAVGRAGFARRLTRNNWRDTFRFNSELAEPKSSSDARSMFRFAHPDQWIACAHVTGFGRDASNKRGLIATRVALDTIRLVIARGHRQLIFTAADHSAPFAVDGISQLPGRDVSRRWRMNRPGVGGQPGLAQQIVNSAADLFIAAGRCIQSATENPTTHECPKLADRWLNSCHWFGRACLTDADFTAIVMLVIALDVLSGGLMDSGITELVARLHDVSASQPVFPNVPLRKLVVKSYKLRSEVAHGSILAVHGQLDVERWQLEDLAATAICEYAIRLDTYAAGGGVDDRDAFLASLPPFKP